MGLRAALLLARGRPEGAFLISMEGPAAQFARARHSFIAMLFCVPLFLVVQNMGKIGPDVPDPSGITAAREFASFILAWLGYAVLSYRLAGTFGCTPDWPRFIVLWNWCNFVQYLLILGAMVPSLAGAPAIIGQTAGIVAIGWSVWLQWSATRIALNLRGGQAALMVAADMTLGMVVLKLTAG